MRLFNIEDTYFVSDMAEVEAMMFDLQKSMEEVKKVEPTKLIKNKDGIYEVKKSAMNTESSCGCCCISHCKLSVHSMSGSLLGVSLVTKVQGLDMSTYEYPNIFEKDLSDDGAKYV